MSTTPTHVSGFAVGKHRIEALSDGVYAIALTLLVLELKLPPALDHHAGDAALREALVGLLPKILAWLLSFLVVALIWVAQQRLYKLAERIDWRLCQIELFMLALISLLPFSTALVGEYGTRVTASAVYAAHLAAIALTGFVRSSYFLRHAELHVPNVDPRSIREMKVRSVSFIVATFATFALAFFFPAKNMFAMLLAFGGPLVTRLRRKSERA